MSDEVTQEQKADFVLKSGKEINFNLDELSHTDWVGLINPKQSKKKEEEIFSRVFGLTVEELGKLTEIEYRKLSKALVVRVVNPFTDPNA
jgi:hypothetical protein